MMKRSLTKSGSTITSQSTQNGNTIVPPYQPMTQLSSTSNNSISAKLTSLENHSTNLYSILQESKLNNNNNMNNIKKLQTNPSSSAIGQNSLLQSKSSSSIYSQNNIVTGQQSQPSQLIGQSLSSNIISAGQILNSTSKQQDGLQQTNSRLLMSTQKNSSMHNASHINNQSSLSNNYTSNHQSSTSKSPLSHQYKASGQYTPTSQKNTSSNQSGISPKIILNTGSKSATMFHSHRPSLATTSNQNQLNSNSNTNQYLLLMNQNNENINNNHNNKIGRDSKSETNKKTSSNIEQPNQQQSQLPIKSASFVQSSSIYSAQQPNSVLGNNMNYGINNYRSESMSSSNNILKDSNIQKNSLSHHINSARSNEINKIASNNHYNTNPVTANTINSLFQQNQQQQQQSQQQILLSQQHQNKELQQNTPNQILQSQQKNLRINSCSNLESSQLSNNLNTSNNMNLSSNSINTNNINANNNINITQNSITNMMQNSGASNGIQQKTANNSEMENENQNQNINIQQKQPFNSLSSFYTINRTPKGKISSRTHGSVQSKGNIQQIFNTSSQTQNSEMEMLQTAISEQNNQMNTSNLSANITNLTERSTSQPDINNIQHLYTASNTLSDSIQQNLFSSKCCNHPDKKAKYLIRNSQQSNNLYCSKCAVQFSKYGYQTIHIQDFANQQQSQEEDIHIPQQEEQQNQEISSAQPSEETQIKLKEIENFLTSINSQGEKWQELNHALLLKKKDVSSFYERQQGRLEAQYKGLIELITAIKDQSMEKLQASREQSVQIYQTWEKDTKESLTDFLNIKADIEMNTDKIINLIQMDDFSRIMNSYKDKLAKMSQFFYLISNECLDVVKFSQQKPSNQLQPLIESLFITSSFTTTLIKKRVSEVMNNPHQLQNNSISLNQSTQSNFNKDSSLSPNLKSGRISTSILENYNSNSNISTRGSLACSQSLFQNFGSNINKQATPQSHLNHQMDVIQEDEISDRQPISSFHQPQSNESACNSPVKNENASRHEIGKKDIYVSFGNPKEGSSFHKAIQQNNIKNQEQNNTHNLQQDYNINNNIDSYNNSISTSHLQATPVQNMGVFIHQIKPLTDIMEHSNINEEEEKSQPNTPELKQADEIQSKITPSSNIGKNGLNNNESSQKSTFRKLFGGDDDTTNLLRQQENNNQNFIPSYQTSNQQNAFENQKIEISNYNSNHTNQLIKSPSQINQSVKVQSLLNQSNQLSSLVKSPSQVNVNMNNGNRQSIQSSSKQIENSQQINNSLSTSYKYNSQPVNTKSPRYSMYECDENNDNSDTYAIPKNNNQLDDYIQMLERSNNQPQIESDINNQNKTIPKPYIPNNNFNMREYFPSIQNLIPTQNQVQSTSETNKNIIPNQQINLHCDDNVLAHQQDDDDDEVIVTNLKQEEFDNPLFSSPGYKN